MRCFVVLSAVLLLQVFTAEGVDIGQNCGAEKAGCPDNSDCETATSTPCLCNEGYVASDDNKKCLAKIDTNCNADKDDCPANAACETASTKPCLCNDGYVAKSDKTGCDKKSGAAGVTISFVLLMAAFVTSRFL